MRMLLGAVRAIASSRPQATLTDGKCTRYFASDCTICVDACPVTAIDTTDLSITIGDSCHGCGICAAACPVDAICGVGYSTVSVSTVLEEESRLQCDLAQRIDRSSTDASVPCLGAVDPEIVASRAMKQDVVLTSGPCEQCPIGSAQTVTGAVDRAQKIVSKSGGAGTITHRYAEPAQGKSVRRRPSAGVSRRGVFEAGTYAGPAKDPRQLLLESTALPALPQAKAAVGCTGCNACVVVCPVDALEVRGRDLVFKPASCLACAECVRVCPEGILSLDDVGIGRFPTVIAQAPLAKCERCEATLGPGETGQCHRCKTRAELTVDIWHQLGIEP